MQSKIGHEYPDQKKYICMINDLKKWITMNSKIEVKELAKMDLAYISCLGPENLGLSFQKLMKWAAPQGLMNEHTKMLTIYFDSFKLTEAQKVRMNACILLTEPTEIHGEIGLTTIEKGKHIIGRYTIQAHEFEKSWTGLFVWMNENGFKKSKRNPFEIYYNNINEHPEKKVTVDLCIPIE